LRGGDLLFRRERTDHTLQTTALVHEAYLRLVDQKEVTWNNRAHFFAVAAQMMRRILVDYARKHKALKRGSSVPKISLEQAAVFSKEQTHEMLVVDELLTRLASFDPQGGRIVELRFYGGLSVEETAEVMSISSAKVKREWTVAKLGSCAKSADRALPQSANRKQKCAGLGSPFRRSIGVAAYLDETLDYPVAMRFNHA